MESSFTLLRVRGIPIGAHWSWLFVVAIVVWSLAEALFPATYPELDGQTHLVMALVSAVLLFGSIILHELGHALRALDEGMPIKGITLWLFGGVAHLSGAPPSPRAEFHVAACGPLVSLVLAAGFGAAAVVGEETGWPREVQGVVYYLARINLVVLAFNMVPALPLDGGRILRSWLWKRQEDFAAATRSAAKAGKAFGFMLIAVGFLGLFSGSGLGGVWLAFIGWFLVRAAQSEQNQAMIESALDGLVVRDVMVPARAPSQDGHAEPHSPHGPGPNAHPEVPLPPPSGTRPNGQREAPLPPRGEAGANVEADAPLTDALAALEESGRAVVVDHDRQVGELRIVDVAAAVERRAEEPEPPTQRAGITVWVVVGLIILLAGAALYRPPYVVMAPGRAVDITDDIEVSGIDTGPVNGAYLLTSVTVGRTNALGTLWAALQNDREVLALSSLFPEGVSRQEYSQIQRQAFDDSRMVAAAAAARALGLAVDVTGSGATVAEVIAGAPAAGELETGDVIVAVDGDEVDTASDLVTIIGSRPAGSSFDLTVERDDSRQEVTVESADLSDLDGGVGIGVLIDTRGFDVDLPFDITFKDRDIGGPSAGLAYALAVADLIDDRDLAAGRTVAATGTIDSSGDVGPVGGVEQKAIAVADADADVFVVPEDEVEEAERADLVVRGVGDLNDALRLLA